MQLSKNALSIINERNNLQLPAIAHLELPEKVLQFGTGVLLRGLPDYFIDKANKAGIFNGRVVIVKSTDKGGTDAFVTQQNLYTQCVQGIAQGQKVEEYIVNAAISRVISAATQWEAILACAENPAMEIIISNTTEVGITLTDDDVKATPPASFPCKLLAFLLRRYGYFKGDISKGMVIIPTELIPDNGKKLKAIVLELASRNHLGKDFINWLEKANHFCSSLVDRIVPGALPAAAHAAVEKELGYKDELMIMSEVYSLWAIEADDPKVNEILSFAKADSGVVIAPDINVFRELKLRLLNGTHTLSCGLAILAGIDTVKSAMDNAAMEAFISTLMKSEIIPAITDMHIREDAALRFAGNVLDRFRNPYIEHRWESITVQYTSKMRMRVVPFLQKHYQRSQEVPALTALGFAAYMQYIATAQAKLTDDAANAASIRKWQSQLDSPSLLEVLSDVTLWGIDLTGLKGFAHAVGIMVGALINEGAEDLIKRVSGELTY
ncbi:tagaturonate reductase [Chitinophaga sp. CF118]|uniref:tagaturonate reductase n=1 Tax=Chitinophaga sp. CF118 TaxID=1884367 RepID=UPI0008F1B8B0|nr:tagaturonate reductase [Chitinophaga sp. CF118]SFD53887.1 tagaturonate reductase [Chitinophaga sp. CF118]